MENTKALAFRLSAALEAPSSQSKSVVVKIACSKKPSRNQTICQTVRKEAVTQHPNHAEAPDTDSSRSTKISTSDNSQVQAAAYEVEIHN